MKNKIYQFWEKGYLYIGIAFLLYLIFSLHLNTFIFDWSKERAYCQFIKISLTDFHSWPFFWWNVSSKVLWFPAIAHTLNFISIPETLVFSPFLPLIFWLNPLPFIKIVSLIHFFIGVAGLFFLKKRLNWNHQQFRWFAAFFLLSPVIIQRLVVGFTPWINLFFFPWLIYFFADQKLLRSSLGITVIFALTLLQGGVHVFVWFGLFFLFYHLLDFFLGLHWSSLGRLGLVFLITPFLAFVRIFTTAQAYENFQKTPSVGYNFINFLFWALTPPVISSPFRELNRLFYKELIPLGAQDAGIFYGALLFLFILIAFKYRKFKTQFETPLNFDAFLLSASLMYLLAFFSIYEFLVKTLKIPFLARETFPFRLAIIGFFGYSLIAAQFSENIWQTIQKWLVFLKQRFNLPGFFKKCFLFLAEFLAYLLGAFLVISFVTKKSIILLLIYLVLILLIQLKRPKIKAFFKNQPLVLFELILIVPLVFAGSMWLSLAISEPAYNYQTPKLKPPVFKTVPSDAAIVMKTMVTPQKLVLCPNKKFEALTFERINFTDQKYLQITTHNGRFICSDKGKLSLIPENTSPIIIEYKTESFKLALSVTLAAWFVFILGVLALKIFQRLGRGFWTGG